MLKLLTHDLYFPNVGEATPEGLVAVGGDLSPERLLLAYKQGLYPWYDNFQPILWWSPDPRGIIPLDGFHIGRTLQKVLRRKIYETRIDTAFEDVIRACAVRADGSESGWITDDMIEAYIKLYNLGYAHSVESWKDERLAGGVYGVAINGLFAGESMFYREPNASKSALARLVEYLNNKGFTLLDCQMVTNATKAMGAIEIRRDEYLKLLAEALKNPCLF